jgi:geranylgeranylglycerol-phosphate geranylgeranyltransferase
LRLARPLNLLMVAIGVVTGYLVETGMEVSYGIILAPLVVVCASAGGNSLNDYYDREIDKVVHPSRPIPSGELQPEGVLIFSTGCFILAMVLAIFTTWLCLLILALNICLMIGYEKKLKQKGIVGNLVISYLVGSLFLFGGAATGSLNKTLILVLLATLAILGREIAKDVEDLEGDKIDRLTLPMKIGKRKASIVASSLIFSAVALSPLPYILKLYGPSFIYILIPADLLFVLSAILMLQKTKLGEGLAKYGMILGIGAFLGGSFL